MILPKGFYPNMPFDEYFSFENISKHQLDALSRSPAHYRAALAAPRKQTPAMVFGQALHMAVLEPADFASHYAPAPDVDKRTKAGKLAFEWAASGGKRVLKAEEWIAIEEMQAAISRQPYASILLRTEDGDAEVSIAWVDEETGVPCRARPDFVNHAHTVVVELKTAQDASMGAFARACVNYTYALQAAMYLDGMAAVKPAKWNFVFVVVETEPPYAVACYELDEEDVRVGRVRYHHACVTYKQCVATDNWPSYPEQIRTLELPAWSRFVPVS